MFEKLFSAFIEYFKNKLEFEVARFARFMTTHAASDHIV